MRTYLYTLLCLCMAIFSIGPITRTAPSQPDPKIQRRLAIERARIRDSIRKKFLTASRQKSSAKKSSGKKPALKRPKKAPQKAAQKLAPKKSQKKAAPKKAQTKKLVKRSQKKKPQTKSSKPARRKSPKSSSKAPQKKAPVRASKKKRASQRKRPRARTYSGSQKPKPKDKSAQQRLRSLRRTIRNLVHEADKNVSIGVKVVLLKNKSTVYEKNANQLFKPGSSTKLLTAAAAYHILGPQYRFKTTLFTDKKIGTHAINNLYIRGSGDPTLTDRDLTTLVRRLKNQGIKEIKGDIIVDASIFNMQGTGPGWRTGDAAVNKSKAPTGGLMVNHSCIRVRVKPSRTVGRKPHVRVEPHTPYVRIINKATTKNKTNGRSLKVLRGANNTIIVRGALSKRSKTKNYRITVEQPHRYAGQILAGLLKKNMVRFSGKVKTGRVPKTGKYLAEHTSKKLSGMIRYMMKASDNLYADAIFRAMGAHMYGAPGTWTKGKKAVNSFLKNTVGLDISALKIYDGSGLSHKNQLSPNHFIKLLTWVYTSSPHKQSFIGSLPIGGVDGTLKHRMKHHSTRETVKAKTGSLCGVTSLSGYITPKTGLPLIFVIMVNRRHKSAVIFKRKLEDQLCKLLAAHAFSTS